MSLLSAIFGTAIRARNTLYDQGLLKSHRLAGPVISVGNIRVGGAGKTPFVILLGELLKQRGIAFDVLSRGYGRKTRGIAVVDASGTPADFGDEPLLIARKLGVPVIVGADRHAAGLFAEQRFGPQLHLLDDGFQHRRLARDYDIVLLTPTDIQDKLLPTGRLREPLSSLRRADAVVVQEDLSHAALEQLSRYAQVVCGRGCAPSQTSRELEDWRTPHGREANLGKCTRAGAAASRNQLFLFRLRRGIRADGIPSGPLAFSAIARPERFIDDLLRAGIDPAEDVRFPDHHAYDRGDIDLLLKLAAERHAQGFVTTEKDAINLGELASALQPLSVVPVVATLDDADTALDRILATIAQRRGTGHSPVPTR